MPGINRHPPKTVKDSITKMGFPLPLIMSKPFCGIDNFLLQARDKDKRLAFVTNNAALTFDGIKSREALLQNNFNLVKLFSPEHGLSAAGADGSFQKNNIDGLTGLPVISLYGEHLAPTADELEDIDIVLYDIPDVGCRYYTYLWTMENVMRSCSGFNTPLIILDRPNPLSGNLLLAEGPMLEEECFSFLGKWNIPIRHSCTFGELAKYFAVTKIKPLDLEIIKITNWQRYQIATWFTPTSPAIQNITTALFYPGMGLLEGINVNEGRGTGKPFTICGAPWINSKELAHAFKQKNCKGVSATPYSYTPTEGPYAGELCNGIAFSITDENELGPVATGIALLQTIIGLYPGDVKERLYPTVANPAGTNHLDKLLGIPQSFLKLKKGEEINTDTGNWSTMIEPYLLYS